MIVTLEEFNTYTNNFSNITDEVNQKQTMINAAEEIVFSYLGYNPLLQERTEKVSGLGMDFVVLSARPVVDIDSVWINGKEIVEPSVDFGDDSVITRTDGDFPAGWKNIKVTYTAGWSAEDVPSSIKMAIMEIAALKLQEASGNIGLTGRSLGDNTRTFVNYSNYKKHLQNIDQYRSGV